MKVYFITEIVPVGRNFPAVVPLCPTKKARPSGPPPAEGTGLCHHASAACRSCSASSGESVSSARICRSACFMVRMGGCPISI